MMLPVGSLHLGKIGQSTTVDYRASGKSHDVVLTVHTDREVALPPQEAANFGLFLLVLSNEPPDLEWLRAHGVDEVALGNLKLNLQLLLEDLGGIGE